jgi:CheY-like chemotaxis protein
MIEVLPALTRLVLALHRSFEPPLLQIATAAESGLSLLSLDADEAVAKELHRVRDLCAHLDELLLKLATFAGQRPFSLDPLSLDSWLAEVQPTLAVSLGPQTVLKIVPAAPTTIVVADRHLLLHALLLLLDNTRWAAATSVAVETAERDDPKTGSRFGVLRVVDDGSGMSPALCSLALQPFVSTRATALGMGLSEVYGIARQARGRIVITSEPGEGSTVEVWLPLASAPSSTPRAARATILLVEDEALVRRSIRHILEGAGYRVLEASSADEARRIIAGDQPVDVMITDVVMPDANGVELVRELSSRTVPIKALLMSGYSAEVLDLPPDIPLAQKPFRNKELLELIDKLLRT